MRAVYAVSMRLLHACGSIGQRTLPPHSTDRSSCHDQPRMLAARARFKHVMRPPADATNDGDSATGVPL